MRGKQFQTPSTAQSASTDHSSSSQTHCTAESQRIKQQSLFYLCLYLLLCRYLHSVNSCILINQTVIRLSMHIQFALGYINVLGKMDINSILTLYANITELISTGIVVTAGVKFAILLKCRTPWRVFTWSFQKRVATCLSKLHKICTPLYSLALFRHLVNMDSILRKHCFQCKGYS